MRLSLLFVALSFGCSGASPSVDTPLAPRCGGEPSFDAEAPALPGPESFVSVALSLPKERIEKQLDEAVPWTLAKASGRSAGVAGKVSYEVRRSPLRLAVKDGDLVVTTELVAEIDVCKPLGPVCLHYGKCRPEWHAVITVPPLTALGDAPRPRLSLGITKGCVLSPVGYDATPELERITQEQARSARGEIGRHVAAGHAEVVRAIEEARRGFRLADESCVSIEPLAVQQTPLQLREGLVELSVAAKARVGFECARGPAPEPYEAADAELPLIETVESVEPQSSVLLTRDLGLDSLASSLAREGVTVRFESGVLGGSTRLLAGVSGLGRCEPEWVVVEPRVVEDRVLFSPLGAEVGASSGADWLRAHGSVALPGELARLRTQLSDVEGRIESETARRLVVTGVRVVAPLNVVPTALVGSDALRVGYRLEGALSIEAPSVDAPSVDASEP